MKRKTRLNFTPDAVTHSIELFADDSNLLSHIKSNDEIVSLQDNLYVLDNWANMCLMKFNTSNGKLIHFSKSGKSKYWNLRLRLVPREQKLVYWDWKGLGFRTLEKLETRSPYPIPSNQRSGQFKRTFKYWFNSDLNLILV